MFDIDGTLPETIMKVDEECFVRSFKDVFDLIDADWSHYPSTDRIRIFHDVSSRVSAGRRRHRKFRDIRQHCPIARCRFITVSFCTGCRS